MGGSKKRAAVPTVAVSKNKSGSIVHSPVIAIVVFVCVVVVSVMAAVLWPSLHHTGKGTGGLRGSTAGGGGPGDISELKFLQWPGEAQVEADSSVVGLVKHQYKKNSSVSDKKRSFYALQAHADIKANQSLLSIPYASCISVGQAVDDAVLGPVLTELKPLLSGNAAAPPATEKKEEDQGKEREVAILFDTTEPSEVERTRGILPTTSTRWTFEQFALVSHILRQRSLGDASFWAPWLGQTTTPGSPPPNDYSWSWKTTKKCVNSALKDTMDQSLKYLGRVLKTVVMAANKSPAYAEAVFGSAKAAEAHQKDPSMLLEHVRWALSLIRTRGWEQPEPVHMLIVPILDLLDTRSGVVNWTNVPQPASKQPTSVAVTPLFDRETGRVHIVTAAPSNGAASSGHIKKGTYLSTSYDGGKQRRVLQDSLRYYGHTSVSSADLVDSYWDFEASLKSAFVLHYRRNLGSDGEDKPQEAEKLGQFLAALQKGQPSVFGNCTWRNARLFYEAIGTPTPQMSTCLEFVAGAINGLETDGSNSTSAAELWKGHATKVLANIHTKDLRDTCQSYVEDGVRAQQPNSRGGASSATDRRAASQRRTILELYRGAADLLMMEESLATAFGRAVG